MKEIFMFQAKITFRATYVTFFTFCKPLIVRCRSVLHSKKLYFHNFA